MSARRTGEPRWRRYLTFWGQDPATDVDEELELHLELRTEEYLRQGLSPEAARAAARGRFGDVEGVRAACVASGKRRVRSASRTELLLALRQDLAFALRQLRRSPGFALAAILTLGLGIGANSAVFSLIDPLLFRPLPGVRAPEELYTVTRSISVGALRELRTRAAPLLDLAGSQQRTLSMFDGGQGKLVTAGVASGNFLQLVGARVEQGRTLGDADDVPGAPATAVLSHSFWRSALAGDPAVIGRTLTISGAPVTVVGVLAEPFHGTRVQAPCNLWITIAAWPQLAPSSMRTFSTELWNWNWLTPVVRLRPGTSPAQAEHALQAAAKAIAAEHAKDNPTHYELHLAPAGESALPFPRGEVVRSAALLFAVMAMVLLLACANVANLLLARAASRRRELAVRLSLGASRARLLRQLATEALVLGLAAGAAGIVLSMLASLGLQAAELPGIPSAALAASLDARKIGFTLLVSLGATFAFGLLPALQASRPGLSEALRDGGAADGRSRSRLRDALLVLQVALCLVLLIGAGLFARGLQRALQLDPGFAPRGVATAVLNPGLVRYDAARTEPLYSRALASAAALPGVRAVGLSSMLPLSGEEDSESFRVEGYTPRAGEELEADVVFITPGTLDALGVAMRAGRGFTEADAAPQVHVVLINETFAKRFFPGQDPIGRRVTLVREEATIIGVTHDVQLLRLDDPPAPFFFLPFHAGLPERGLGPMYLLARTGPADADAAERNAAALLRPLTAALQFAGPEVPIYAVATLDATLSALLLPQRGGALLLGLFGALALLVAAVGVGGVVAFNVSRREREIGIRLALGAPPSGVQRMVVSQTLRRVALGVGLGCALAIAGTRAAAGLLYGLSPTDPPTFAATAALLGAVALLAAWLPARRAARIDPMQALRSD